MGAVHGREWVYIWMALAQIKIICLMICYSQSLAIDHPKSAERPRFPNDSVSSFPSAVDTVA